MSNQPTYPVSERWRVSVNGKALEAQLHFPTFKKTWEFLNLVATSAAEHRHHPEWANASYQTYNKVFMRWTTHDTGGISDKDVEMAKICDGYAASLGERAAVAGGVTTEGGESGLVNLVKELPG